jgi:YVTN family beta-propeller protein
MMTRNFLYFSALISLTIATGCHSFTGKHSATENTPDAHSSYDDSTLRQTQAPFLLPYNRIIQAAGEVVRYGSAETENHTLDVKVIPGSSVLAVEDRYGIAVIDPQAKTVVARWGYTSDTKYRSLMSTYSGIQVLKEDGKTSILWSASDSRQSYVLKAVWADQKLALADAIPFKPEGDSPLALPNELAVSQEDGTNYLFVVLNGNNRLVKMNLKTHAIQWSQPTGVAPYGLVLANGKAYVSNWGGTMPAAGDKRETAGVPYGKTFVDPKTGAIDNGTLSIFNAKSGASIAEIKTGLHPNDIIASNDGHLIYVANGNSDNVTVIDATTNEVAATIPVNLFKDKQHFIGDTPNALLLSADERTLYVANGMDNAVAVVGLNGANGTVKGFIPTEAYPGGLALNGNTLFVTNLEGEGAHVNSMSIAPGRETPKTPGGAYNSHHQLATLSIIPLPDASKLSEYTEQVKKLNLSFRAEIAGLMPRRGVAPQPVPERIGEPSVFKHVLYIIKENRTYDQVLGDMKEGDGNADLCVFGNQVTPNQHQLARDFMLLDNYYASGKCSAEGHQWTDAAMVTDYIEKNVRAWFRSYPHVQTDALVYDQNGFIWNNAADHGKNVRIYGEACTPHYEAGTTWSKVYDGYKTGKPFKFTNSTTISRVRPMLSPNYACGSDLTIPDQLRATQFIDELNNYEKQSGDQLPQLMVMALPCDHTGGTRPGTPTPRAQVADNDLAVGRIIEALSKSRFWKNTVVFVTEDDSQAGWDHVSAYRTTGFVASPYSRLKQTVHVNYNQTCVVRTIEQILGIPPMNSIDATALPMFKCFNNTPDLSVYKALPNQIAIDELNPKLSTLKGRDLYFARQSLRPEFDHIDGGNDDLMNRIIWHSAKKSAPYPKKFAGKDEDDD